eukprot:6173404-Pleurochrysis_carterae.AAC.2
MQWHKRQVYNNEDPLEETPTPASDTFAAAHKASTAAGYKFQEAGSIVLACSHWYRLITGRPSTVYTDNTVAASVVSNFKCPSPPRLQRWGIELGSYLSYLRIAYRMGSLNDVADLMSRYPKVEEGKHSVVSIADDLFDTLAAEAEVQSIWEAESACTGAQVALLSEYQVVSTDDETAMAAVRGDPRLPDEVRLLPAHLLAHVNALETRPETLQLKARMQTAMLFLALIVVANWLPHLNSRKKVALRRRKRSTGNAM